MLTEDWYYTGNKDHKTTGGMTVDGRRHNLLVKLKRVGWFLGKIKYGLLVVVILGVGLIGWQVHRNSVNNSWKRATDYYTRADYSNAAKELKHVSMPSDAPRLAIYAQTMLATRQLDKAQEAYTKLYAINKDPFAKLVLGNVYNESKQYDKAIKVYKELIASNPAYVQAYVNLATVYKLQKNDKAAISTAQDAVKANPNDVVLNELLVSMAMNDESSDLFTNAVANLKKLNPHDPLIEALHK